MIAEGEEIRLPDCDLPFLVERLFDIGPVVSGVMGMAPIGWRDIDAWQNCNGVRMPPWQARLMLALSRDYVTFSAAAAVEGCLPPWSDEAMTESRRERVAKQLKSGLRGWMAGQAKRLTSRRSRGDVS